MVNYYFNIAFKIESAVHLKVTNVGISYNLKNQKFTVGDKLKNKLEFN